MRESDCILFWKKELKRMKCQDRIRIAAVLLIAAITSMPLLVESAYAHQPRVVMDYSTSEAKPIDVENPEVSKAYYGQLRGSPDYYSIISDREFELYLNFLVPNQSPDNETRFSADVINATDAANGGYKPVINMLDGIRGSNANWTSFFEPLGQNSYLKGPELRRVLPAGSYIVRVYSPQNVGKYSLAIGEEESFPLSEMLYAAVSIPQVEMQFFYLPPWMAFFNVSGLFILGMIITASVLGKLILMVAKRMKKKGGSQTK
jgi:hypothetical protein